MYNAFKDASKVEDAGLSILIPYLTAKAKDGRIVTTEKGRLSKQFQKKYGDAIINDKGGGLVTVEFKIEENFTGNFFIETWSNCDFDRRNRGWIDHLDTDYIWYYFLETDDLYYIDFRKLWNWAFVDGSIYKCREVDQGKRAQLNKTRGRLVKIPDLMKAGVVTGHCKPLKDMGVSAVIPLSTLKKAS